MRQADEPVVVDGTAMAAVAANGGGAGDQANDAERHADAEEGENGERPSPGGAARRRRCAADLVDEGVPEVGRGARRRGGGWRRGGRDRGRRGGGRISGVRHYGCAGAPLCEPRPNGGGV